jgi:hypothetical protein
MRVNDRIKPDLIPCNRAVREAEMAKRKRSKTASKFKDEFLVFFQIEKKTC